MGNSDKIQLLPLWRMFFSSARAGHCFQTYQKNDALVFCVVKSSSGSEKGSLAQRNCTSCPCSLILLGYVGSLCHPLKSGFHFLDCVPDF